MVCYAYMAIVLIMMILTIYLCLLIFKKKIYSVLTTSRYISIYDDVEYPDTTSRMSDGIIKYIMKQIDMFNIEIINNDNTEHYYIYNDNKKIIKIIMRGNVAWVLVRGTHTYNEFEQDLKISQTQINGGYLCHTGFVNMFNKIKNTLISILIHLKPEKIYFGGHSLGGGILTAGALDIFTTFKNAVILVIGTPRTCNIEYSATMTNYDLFKIINLSDVYVDIIPSIIPFTNSIYDHVGKIMVFNKNYGNIQLNHSLSTYFNSTPYYNIYQTRRQSHNRV